MDFTKETQDAIQKVITEKMPDMIMAHTEKMVQDIVKDIFSWGDTRKNIKQKIEEGINVNLQEFDLIDYNVLIANTINKNLLKQVNLDPIIEMTKDLIGFVNKKTIDLEEIAEMFIEASKEENDSYDGEITFTVGQTEYNYINISADIEKNVNDRECSLQFCISTRDGRIFSFRTREKYLDSDSKIITPLRMTRLDSIEAKLFRLYSANVSVTNYDEEINIYWDRD